MAFCEKCGKEITVGSICEDCAAKAYQPPQFHPEFTAPASQAPSFDSPQTSFRMPLTKDQLPPQFRPIGAWGYFGYSILFAIPLVGFVLLLVFALGGTQNVNLKSYARSFFCGYLVALIVLVLAVAAMLILKIDLPAVQDIIVRI